MKRIFFHLYLFLNLSIVFAQQQSDFIIAKVGREIIMYSDLTQQIAQMKSSHAWDERITERDLLNDMIYSKLIIQKARELNIKVDERRIQNAVETQINNVKAQFSTEEEFFRQLRAAGLLPSDLRHMYEEMFTEQYLRDHLIQSEIRNKIKIFEPDLINYYHTVQDSLPQKDESYELAVIMRIPGPSAATIQEIQAKLTLIQNRLQAGEDFALLAREFSECPSAPQGGDLGFFGRGIMVKEFEEAAFKLDVGDISPIVRTQFGYHIIKVTAKKETEIQASHILILFNESEEDVTRERLFTEELHERLVNGENFGDLAREYSQDSDTNTNQGIMGIFTRQEFPHFFISDLENLSVGSVSSVLENQQIFYIFKINQVYPPRSFEYWEIKEQLEEMLTNQKQKELFDEWVEDLKKEIYIQIYEDKI